MEKTVLIKADKLYKCYNPRSKPRFYAVRNVSLDIYRGEILGLVGESGCGKSTLGKLLLKLEQPSLELKNGSILFDGEDITHYSFERMRPQRRRMQMIFQGSSQAFNPYFSVRNIIGEPLDNFSDEPKTIKEQKMIDMLCKVGLDESYLGRYAHEMSGGQRQRVGIARALILNPEFVVCDEPVSSVDYAVKHKILSLLTTLKQELSLTYLFISHDIAAVNSICDRVVVMYLGNIVEIIPNINDDAMHPYTKALLAATLTTDPRKRERNIVLFKEDEDMSVPERGCVFENRCLYAKSICKTEQPKLKQYGDRRFVACHLCE
jgi:peptide/nickel transport system ATP-binding protein/oligopeptide transport system ATP-binding protein